MKKSVVVGNSGKSLYFAKNETCEKIRGNEKFRKIMIFEKKNDTCAWTPNLIFYT